MIPAAHQLKHCKISGCRRPLRKQNKSGLCTFHYVQSYQKMYPKKKSGVIMKPPIKCPLCKEGYLVLKTPRNNGQKEETLNCTNCVHFFPHDYFERFKQYKVIE